MSSILLRTSFGKSPTASVRELHVICKGPSGKEQRKGTLSVANPVNENLDPLDSGVLMLSIDSQSFT